jgi:transcriptional regulator with GAF, ATPase, and Fis domain
MEIKSIVLDLNAEFKKEQPDKKIIVSGINQIVQAYNLLSSAMKNSAGQSEEDVTDLRKSLALGERKFKKKVIDLQTVMEIAKELNSSFDISSLIKTIILTSMGHLLVETAIIFVLDETKGVFFVREGKGVKNDLSSFFFKYDDPFISLLKTNAKPLSKDELSSLDITPATKDILIRMEGEILVPLLIKDKMNGILVLGPRMGDMPFTDFNIEFLVTLGNFASIAIENARLYQDLDNKVKDLSMLYNISSEINKSEEMDVVIDLLMDTITTGFGAQKCSLVMYDELKNVYRIERDVNIDAETSKLYLKTLLEQDNPVQSGERIFLDAHPSLNKGDILFSIPLIAGSKKVGLLNIYRFREDVVFNTSTEHLFAIMASQIAPPLVLSQYLSKRNEYRENPFDFIYHALDDMVKRSNSTGADFSAIRLWITEKDLQLTKMKEIIHKIKSVLQDTDQLIHVNFNEVLILMPVSTRAEIESLLKDFIPTVTSVKIQYRIASFPGDGDNVNAILTALFNTGL